LTGSLLTLYLEGGHRQALTDRWGKLPEALYLLPSTGRRQTVLEATPSDEGANTASDPELYRLVLEQKG